MNKKMKELTVEKDRKNDLKDINEKFDGVIMRQHDIAQTQKKLQLQINDTNELMKKKVEIDEFLRLESKAMSLPTADDIQRLNSCIDDSIRDFTAKNEEFSHRFQQCCEIVRA